MNAILKDLTRMDVSNEYLRMIRVLSHHGA